jgi:hypothetical protein
VKRIIVIFHGYKPLHLTHFPFLQLKNEKIACKLGGREGDDGGGGRGEK